ncbi:MAG: TrkH family potassium uptake protein [Bacillota bacterium]
MNNKFKQISYYLGAIMSIIAGVLIFPIFIALFQGEEVYNVSVYLVTLFAFLGIGLALIKLYGSRGEINISIGMILCALGWVLASLIIAFPFKFIFKISYLDAYFEAMSGFTTTGITLLQNLETYPLSILFLRAFIQWLGGLGILTFFLLVTFKMGSGIWHLFTAESHKAINSRPVPNIFKTVKILWGIYFILTLTLMILLVILGLSPFDAVTHAFTTLSTGGFSNYDASIDHFRRAGYSNYRVIEYIFILFMFFGGVNFLLYYKLKDRKIRDIIEDNEFVLYVKIIALFSVLIFLSVFISHRFSALEFEENLRKVLFQVVALITTTGYGTVDIGSTYFTAFAKQIFLVLMLIGGSVGSTAGGIKVYRILILKKLFGREIKTLGYPRRAVKPIVINRSIIESSEIYRIAGLFFAWLVFILIGGLITALLSDHGALASISGMFSAVNNIGPSYISISDMIAFNPLIKVTYILGMLVGRLEIIPVIALFNKMVWKK